MTNKSVTGALYGIRKVKPVWILLEQETVSGSGISWAICKQCRINHVADVANATSLRPQGASGSREKIFNPSVIK